MRIALTLILAALWCTSAPAEEPRYTASGELVRPENYREWIFLTSGIGMTYGTQANAGASPPRFDNVFVTPAAYKAFLETGAWPDKTMFALEIRSSESKGSINKGGRFQEGVTALEIEVKDARIPGKWAYFDFGTSKQTAPPLPRTASCHACHSTHGAVENTFVQFYPTLIPVAKAKGTWKKSAAE
jgi:hypothetical protein